MCAIRKKKPSEKRTNRLDSSCQCVSSTGRSSMAVIFRGDVVSIACRKRSCGMGPSWSVETKPNCLREGENMSEPKGCLGWEIRETDVDADVGVDAGARVISNNAVVHVSSVGLSLAMARRRSALFQPKSSI